MLAAEIRRIAGRRGSYWSALLIGLGAVVLMAIIRIYQDGDAGGTEFLDAMGPISLVATLMAVLVGALAGSYDTAQGTMRYLVMTGVPRRRLYATRVLGTAVATIICCAPAIVVGIVAAYVLRHNSFNDPTASSVLGAVWAYLVNPVVYAPRERRRRDRCCARTARRSACRSASRSAAASSRGSSTPT